MTYQSKTGTLSPGGHPGSYNGQDAYNDLLVTNDDVFDSENRRIQGIGAGKYDVCERLQERNRSYFEGGKNDMEHQNEDTSVKTVVRRLTPLECERLQDFPDGWTDIGEWTDTKGKTHKEADSPRYKALGNSIALPFWQYLARRICAQYERDITMGSLFSGIGGFELVFSRCGAKPLWASEIEEFCVAVTKKHFGDDDDEAV